MPPFTYDPTTDAGKVRLLCGDFDPAFEVFNDAAIAAFLDVENGIVKLAAAQALCVIANSEAMIRKVMKVGNQQFDGAKVADALRAGAQALRESLANEVAIDVAQMANGPFVWREIVGKDFWAHAL